MMRLILAEMNRLRSRRIALIAVVAIALVVGLLQIAVYQAVKQPSAAEVAEAQRYYQQAVADYEEHQDEYAQQVQDCIDQGNSADVCQISEPRMEYYLRTPSTYVDISESGLMISVLLVGLVLLFVGASFIGGEYSSGSIANWLSFLPERGKVFFSKLIGLAAPAALISALASALTLVVAAVITHSQDGPITEVGHLAAMAARGIPLVVMLAAIGYCISLVTRHTVGAVGVVLAYLFVTYVRAALAYSLPVLQKLPPWLPESNLLAFLDKGGTYYLQVERRMEDGGISYEQIERHISFGHSAVYLGVLLAVVVVGSYLIFRRRDVG